MPRVKIIQNENDVKKLVKAVFDGFPSWSYAPIQTGMGQHGIPDRVGCVPITITQDMVGSTIGMFVAVEAKAPGRRREKNAGATGQQVDVMRDIQNAHGIAMLVDGEYDAADFEENIEAMRDGGVEYAQKWFKQAFENRINNG